MKKLFLIKTDDEEKEFRRKFPKEFALIDMIKLDEAQEKPKQETLEEAAKFNYDNKTSRIPVPTSHWINSEFLQIQNFIEGAKYQAERMYSKEDLEKAYEHGKLAIIDMGHGDTFEEWFDQFKKK
jgi:hypothetical protein